MAITLVILPALGKEIKINMSTDSVMQERINMTNLRLESDEERKARALARIRAYETRASTVAADAFFDGSGDARKTLAWETLPRRVGELCRVLEAWVRKIIFLLGTMRQCVTGHFISPQFHHSFSLFHDHLGCVWHRVFALGDCRMQKTDLPSYPAPSHKTLEKLDANA